MNCMVCQTNKRSVEAKMRGLCLRCYGDALKMVVAKKTTWEELTELGLCEGGETPFQKMFQQRLREKANAADQQTEIDRDPNYELEDPRTGND